MNPFYALLSAAYIFAIFFLADSGAASQIGEFNPYSLLHIPLYGILTLLILLSLCTGKGEIYPPTPDPGRVHRRNRGRPG